MHRGLDVRNRNSRYVGRQCIPGCGSKDSGCRSFEEMDTKVMRELLGE